MNSNDVWIVFFKNIYTKEFGERLKLDKNTTYPSDCLENTEYKGKLDEIVAKGEAVYTTSAGHEINELNDKAKSEYPQYQNEKNNKKSLKISPDKDIDAVIKDIDKQQLKKKTSKSVEVRFLKDLKLAENSFKKGDIEKFDRKGAEHLIKRKIAEPVDIEKNNSTAQKPETVEQIMESRDVDRETAWRIQKQREEEAYIKDRWAKQEEEKTTKLNNEITDIEKWVWFYYNQGFSIIPLGRSELPPIKMSGFKVKSASSVSLIYIGFDSLSQVQ